MLQIPPWLMAQLPPGLRVEDLLKLMDSRQLAALEALSQLPGPPGSTTSPATSRSPSTERRRLQVQSKGETPSKSASKSLSIAQQLPQQLPSQLISGERRQIEEEIANRILSDISEENSIAGSMVSMDEMGDIQRQRDEVYKFLEIIQLCNY